MSILIPTIGISVGAALAARGVQKRSKFVKALGGDPVSQNFGELVWPYTALRIKMVGNRNALSSELPRTPEVTPFGDSEFTGYGYDITLTVPGGRVWTTYAGFEGAIQTLLRVDRVDPAFPSQSNHRLTYRVYTTLPTDNLQKLWTWDPSRATNSAVSIALGMGQTEPAYATPCTHTMWVGLSGGGKSSVFSALFQNMAADPTVEIWGIDAKPGGGDIKTWGHLCKRIAFGGGPAGDLAMFMLIGQFVESYQNQQGEIPKDRKQFVARGSKVGPDDIEATEERPTKFLLIDEYNLLCDAIRNYLSAKSKDTIRQMAEEVGYDRNPMDDLASILNGARSSNHWLHAVGQNPLATEWLHKKLFQGKGALKLDAPTLSNFFAGSPADKEAARLAWESSVDGLSPADWKKPQAGYLMFGDKDGNWDKIRMYYSEANDLLKLRKAGMAGSPRATNHEIGNSAPWSIDLSSTPVAVGFGQGGAAAIPAPSNNNSPVASPPRAPQAPRQAVQQAPRANPLREVAQSNAPKLDPQSPERGQWVLDALKDLKTAGDTVTYGKVVEIIKRAGLSNFKELATFGVSAGDWNEIEALVYPSDEALPDLFGDEDEAFPTAQISEWEINLQNDERIQDKGDLADAMLLLSGAHPKLTATKTKKVLQMASTDLSTKGSSSYARLNTILSMVEGKAGAN